MPARDYQDRQLAPALSLVLQTLPVKDMAAAAQVCKTLRVTVQALIAKVRSDVSGGAEGMPIPCTSPRYIESHKQLCSV